MPRNSYYVTEATMPTSSYFILFYRFVMSIMQNQSYFSSYTLNHLLGFCETKSPKVNVQLIMVNLKHQIKLFSSIAIVKIKENKHVLLLISIDAASCYRNERDIGNSLKDLFGKHGITRKEIFLTSKVGELCYTQLIIMRNERNRYNTVWNDCHYNTWSFILCYQKIALRTQSLDLMFHEKFISCIS